MLRSILQSRPGRASRMTVLSAALALLFHLLPSGVAPLRAQSSRKDDIVFNSRGIPLAGAAIRICTMPASGQPCSPLAQIYSDPALTQALANPTTTDGLGNYFFYAAPGKYMIEVSGPGITTKQIPNVILPNDPTAPIFSTVSSTGAISAFSLTLSGNLTVNGSTTVLGNLASGTLNLSNQSTPPGAATSGTVNLYTKAADKKLYYQDDTGTETGPLGSGGGGGSPAGNNGDLQSKNGSALQASGLNDNGTTVVNSRDLQNAGPNPHFDIRAFGATTSGASTTGGIASGSHTLTLASAQDFANGQGILVYGAGAATVLATPGTPTVSPNTNNGSTTWNYKVIAEDYKGGLTAASAAGTTTAGAATLGLNSFTITSATRVGGVSTYTTSAPHNLQVGQSVFICQFGGGSCPGTFSDIFNGTKVVASTPTSTTFTVNDGSVADGSESPASGQGWIRACNTLTFPANSFSGTGTLRYWIYRSQGAGAYSLAGVAIGLDPYFVDCGGNPPSPVPYLPATPPSSPQPGYLVTTISSGGGTTTLTLVANASTTVAGASVVHDNSSALLAAMTAAANQAGGTVYIPSVGPGVVFWNFNASTDMTTVSGANSNVITILINANVGIGQPWILRSGLEIRGMTKRSSSFMYSGGANFGSPFGYPLLYIKTKSGITLRNLFLNAGGSQSTDLFSDTDGNSGGSVGVIADSVGFVNAANGDGNARNVVIKGGFDYFFRQVTCDPGSGSAYLPAPCMDFNVSSSAVESPSQSAGRIAIESSNINNSGIRITNQANPITNTGDFRVNGVLAESMFTPFLRIGPMGVATDIELNDVLIADQVAASGTPIVDATGSQLQDVSFTGGLSSSSGGEPVLISTSSGTNLVATHIPTDNPGNIPWFSMRQKGGFPIVEVNNQPLTILGSGRASYAMANPGAPLSCSVSSGGTVPVGTIAYTVTAVDFDNNESLPGAASFVTTTSGNQTVSCTFPSAPTGAKGFNVYRNAFRVTGGAGCSSPQFGTAGSFTDAGTGCGNSAPLINSAAATFLSSTGLSTYQLRLNGDPLTGTAGSTSIAATSRGSYSQGHLPTFDSNANVVDSGVSPTNVTDYFNRASGNLGSEPSSPWTVVAGTLLVTAGGVGGNTSGQNYAAFTGVGFPNDDQSVSAVWVKSGTPSVQSNVLTLRNSTSALTNYNCGPNNTGTTIGINKFVSGSFSSLASQSATINSGDIVSFNVTGSSLNCYVNGVLLVSATDSSIASGFPGLGAFQAYNGNGANLQWKNWMASPGYVSLQRPQTWSQIQTFSPGIVLGSDPVSNGPRAVLGSFLPGALTSTWTGSTIILDKAITVTRVQVQAKTAPSGCSTNAVVRLTDGTTPVNVTVSAAANDSGVISQNYAAGASLTVSLQTAASGCATSPADANALIQYKMQ